MHGAAGKNVSTLLALLLGAILYVALNAAFTHPALQKHMDFTEDRLFTLSSGTLETLSDIADPVTLHFFFSEQLAKEIPDLAKHGRLVDQLLNEISKASGGQVHVQRYNPQPYSTDEDKAIAYGMQGIPFDGSGDSVYFGLAATNTNEDIDRIAFFQSERKALLEYDLVQLIFSLANPNRKVVGVMSSLPLIGDVAAQTGDSPTIPWAITNKLKSRFELINLPQVIDELPARIDTMMVVHPKSLNQRSVYELEQFLFRGGKAIVFLDPKSDADPGPSPDSISSSTGGLDPLLAHWGIQIVKDKLLGDRTLALRVNAGSQLNPVSANHVLWLGVGQNNISREHPATAHLSSLNIASSGSLVQSDTSPLHLEPLTTSTRNSGFIDVNLATGLRPDVLGILKRFKPDEKTHIIAAQLTGMVRTAFGDGPPARIIPGKEKSQIIESPQPVNLILVADTDMLQDRFWLQKQQFFGRTVEREISGNGEFVLSALGHLSGNDTLLELRSRGAATRPFERVDELERKAQARLSDKENELQEQLRQVQSRISEIEGISQTQDPPNGKTVVKLELSADQRRELEENRQQMLAVRQDLRAVQLQLREDVKQLENWMQFINIGLVPLLTFSIALIAFARRRMVLQKSSGKQIHDRIRP